MGRRPLALLVALGIAVTGAAASSSLASSSDVNDGCLATRNAGGFITIWLKSGYVLGQFDSGTLTIDDRTLADSPPTVVNYDQPAQQLTPTKTKYVGDNVRFRASGRVTIRIQGYGIYLSVVGRGWAQLSTQYQPSFAGDYSADADSFCTAKFQSLPTTAQRVAIGRGVAPPLPASP